MCAQDEFSPKEVNLLCTKVCWGRSKDGEGVVFNGKVEKGGLGKINMILLTCEFDENRRA